MATVSNAFRHVWKYSDVYGGVAMKVFFALMVLVLLVGCMVGAWYGEREFPQERLEWIESGAAR
ncbi:hypothetical protein WS68_10780 [Burkholderia sp. TSV86]|nr:hypothetical protein WS68_10780 [Burkholderia sp. TSV86]